MAMSAMGEHTAMTLLRDSEYGAPSIPDSAPAAGRRSRALVGLAAVTAAACCAAPLLLGGSGGDRVRAARVEASSDLAAVFKEEPAEMKCETPENFCSSEEGELSFRDCDGDGHLDAYCEGEELLRFGYISSSEGCKNTWPDGLCRNEQEPRRGPVGTAAGHEITIIHFNDVYEVSGIYDGGVRRGGMSRAAHVIEKHRKRNPDRTFVVFAGDLLSPSALSNLFEGEQMVDILNYLSLDAASLGNHEFDFGVETMLKRIGESKFPWLNTNLFGSDGELLPGTQRNFVKEVPFTPLWGDGEMKTKVCMFGASYDVRETMFKDKELVGHSDSLEASKVEARKLREDGCQVVLALTHQFSREDCKLSAAAGTDIDLILGGHDHSTEMTTVCGHAPFVKADSDLKTQWVMSLFLDDKGRVFSVDGQVLSLTDADPFSHGLHSKVVEWEERGERELSKPVGCAATELDAIAENVRQREMPLGNFFTDAVREQYHTDVAMINGGTIKGNKVFSKGELSRKTITEMHPFGNAVVRVYMTGGEIRRYIAKSLECYSDKCGNFVQISGLKYSFDPAAPAAQRLKSLTRLDGTPVDDQEQFTVAMSDYMLANSPYSDNKLYNMVTVNDAVPIVSALFAAAKKAGDACVHPKVDGRITVVSR